MIKIKEINLFKTLFNSLEPTLFYPICPKVQDLKCLPSLVGLQPFPALDIAVQDRVDIAWQVHWKLGQKAFSRLKKESKVYIQILKLIYQIQPFIKLIIATIIIYLKMKYFS